MLDGTGVTDVTTGVRGIAGAAAPTGTKGNAGPKPGTGVTDSPRSAKKKKVAEYKERKVMEKLAAFFF